MAKKVSQAVKDYVQMQINRNLERKHIGNTLNIVGYDTAGTNYNLNSISQGDDTNQRTGREVRVTSFRFDGVLAYADTTNVVRIILYMPKDEDDTLVGTTVYSLLDHDSFTILSDKLYGVTSAGPGIKRFSIRKSWINGGKARGMLCRYSDTTASVPQMGALKMLIVSDSGTAPHPDITGRYNLYFTDA